jgi:hypothetical protein
MDVDLLQARLQSSKLILGPVEATLRTFFEKEAPPPIGFIAFDLDYYSSTLSALKVFELLAINEFNSAHEYVKVAPVLGLRFFLRWLPQLWHEQIFVAHVFEHPDYNRPISAIKQLPLSKAAQHHLRRPRLREL